MLDLGDGFATCAELAISRGVDCFSQEILCGIVSLPEIMIGGESAYQVSVDSEPAHPERLDSNNLSMCPI